MRLAPGSGGKGRCENCHRGSGRRPSNRFRSGVRKRPWPDGVFVVFVMVMMVLSFFEFWSRPRRSSIGGSLRWAYPPPGRPVLLTADAWPFPSRGPRWRILRPITTATCRPHFPPREEGQARWGSRPSWSLQVPSYHPFTTAGPGGSSRVGWLGTGREQRLLWRGPRWSSTNGKEDDDDDSSSSYSSPPPPPPPPALEEIYQELQQLATLILRHDQLYYYYHHHHQQEEDLAATNRPQETLVPISDEEFDALCRREAEICQQYPQLLATWERESGLGSQATRYGGRVGGGLISSLSPLSSSPPEEILAPPLEKKKKRAPKKSTTKTTFEAPSDHVLEPVVDQVKGPEEVLVADPVAKKKRSKKKTVPTTSSENNNATEESLDLQDDPTKKKKKRKSPQASASSTNSRIIIKRTHLHPMLSLDNVHQPSQLMAWLERIQKKLAAGQQQESNDDSTEPLSEISIVTEPKLDGLSLSLRYERNDNASDTTGWGIETVNINRESSPQDFCLVWAATRGDGRQGQDVTSAMTRGEDRASIPLRLSAAFLAPALPDDCRALEIRGEIVLPKSVFARLQQQEPPPTTLETLSPSNETEQLVSVMRSFSNARNAASGILLRKEALEGEAADNGHDIQTELRYYAYDLVTDKEAFPINGTATREILSALGFSTPQPSVTTVLSFENGTAWLEEDLTSIWEYFDSLQRHRNGENVNAAFGDYDMDGCVHKISDRAVRAMMGSSNRAPRWATAHKFSPLAAVTQLLDVEVQVGRTGALTPVAVLQPVELAGVKIQRATMHNFAHMKQMLGGTTDRIPKGSQVLVRRAGDVIPQVVSRVDKMLLSGNKSESIALLPPATCPACGSMTILDINSTRSEDKGSVGQMLRCGGPSLLCPPRAVGALEHAYSRDALDINGLSGARIQQLKDANLIHIPSDLFTLINDTEKMEQLMELDGWGETSARKLAAVANKVASEGVPLAKFIYSLGIRHVGVHSSNQLAQIYGSLEKFLLDLDIANTKSDSDVEAFNMLQEENDYTKGIGSAILSSLESFAKEDDLVLATHKLASAVKVLDMDPAVSSPSLDEGTARELPLFGLSVVFTGTIASFSRTELHELARTMGAKATPKTVTKSTGLVVAGSRGGKKREQAELLGVKVIEAEDFFSMVEDFRTKTVIVN